MELKPDVVIMDLMMPKKDGAAATAEILEGLTRGFTNKDIAAGLGIRKDRVKVHINTIFSKLGAANRTEAVAIALRKHLLKI